MADPYREVSYERVSRCLKVAQQTRQVMLFSIVLLVAFSEDS